ncbi:MAG: hypothetical protein HGA97_03140 [Chlorobiaceae bacterium]|nr:hypothetical protein [Chlorobiaceae bacterium]
MKFCIRSVVGMMALLVFASMVTVSASAICRGDSDTVLLRNYEGTVGDKYPVRMTIIINGDRIEGVYCYASQLRSIGLRGRLIDGRRFEMDESDAGGKVTGHFEGEFTEKDPRGTFGASELQCEVMTGWWNKDGDPSNKLPFYLTLESQTGGTLEHRYSAAGADHDELIERNAQRFCAAVKQGDRKTVAALITYPVKVHIGKGDRKMKNAGMLIRNYDALFTLRYVEAITKAIPKFMFVKSEGIMLGSGEVWFGPDGKVIAINN